MTANDKMKKCVKDMDFQTETEYYQYIIDSFLNGQQQQAHRLFIDMPVFNRKDMIKLLLLNELSGLGDHIINGLIDLI